MCLYYDIFILSKMYLLSNIFLKLSVCKTKGKFNLTQLNVLTF